MRMTAKTLRNTTSQLNVSCAENVSNNSPCGSGQRPAGREQPNGMYTNRVAHVQEEHRRLFVYRPPAPRARSSKPSNSSLNKRRIVPGRNGQAIAINMMDTWTHSFVSNTNDAQMLSCGDKAKLSMAGLGEKKIVFHKEGKWAHANEKLLQTFPKLKDGGGTKYFELMLTKSI